MNDLQVVFWRIAAHLLPQQVGVVAPLNIETASVPGLFEKLNDGWKPLSHTITPIDGGDVLLSLFMVRDSTPNIPDTVEEL